MNWIDKVKKLLNLKEEERMQEKKCNKCGVVKPVTEFHKSYSKRLGVQGTCKECRSSLNKKQEEREIMETKMCFRCKEVKPVMEFYNCIRNGDHLQSYCKVCQEEVLLKLKSKIPSTEERNKIITKLETFVCNENVSIAAEEKRTATRKIILSKKGNELLKLKEVVAKQAEIIEPEPLFLEQEQYNKNVEVVWESVGKLDPIAEVTKEIINIFKSHSGTNDYGVITNCKLSNGELKEVMQKLVDTGILEQRWCKERGKYGYRYKTPNIFLKEDKGQLSA